MKSPFASVRLGLCGDRLAFWLAAGSALVMTDSVWRLEAPPEWPSNRGPSPAPIPDRLAREAIARGARVVLPDGDLFASAT